jgi:hypothetical protein
LVATIRDRYQAAARRDKQRILDEFVALTGYHRKHAVRVLGSAIDEEQPSRPPRERIYGVAVRDALVMLREASDRVCGKRLKPLQPTLVTALERPASGIDRRFTLVQARPYPTGVVGLRYTRAA